VNDCEVLPADLFMKNPQKLPVNPQTVTVASEGFGTDPHTPRGDFSRGITLKYICAHTYIYILYIHIHAYTNIHTFLVRIPISMCVYM